MSSNPEVFVSISLSMVGCCFTLLTYFLFPDLRTNSRSFACWLALGGIGFSSTVFFHGGESQSLVCMIESFIESYFSLVTLFTTVIYCVTIANLFATLDSSSRVDRHTIVVKPVHIIFVWVIPFLIALLPYTTGSYGRNRSDLYCWIKTDTHNRSTNQAGYAWEFLILYMWVILAICYTFFIYSTVVRRIYQWEGKEPYIVRTKAVVNRMMLYPFILAAVYTAPLIHRLLEPFGTNPLWLIRLSIFTLKLQGFLDAIAYGLSPAIIVRWKLVFLSLHAYFLTGKFVMLSEEKREATDGHAGSTPEMFKQYRNASEVDIEMTESGHNRRDSISSEGDRNNSHEDDTFEEDMKVYDVYSGTEDENDPTLLPQPKVGGSTNASRSDGSGGSRAKTFSATGLTNFYGEDFDY